MPISLRSPVSPAITRSSIPATSTRRAASSAVGSRTGCSGLAYAHGLMWPRTGELRETAIAFLGHQRVEVRRADLRRRHDLRELRDLRVARQQVAADAGHRELRRRGGEPGRAGRAAGQEGAAHVQGAAGGRRRERSPLRRSHDQRCLRPDGRRRTSNPACRSGSTACRRLSARTSDNPFHALKEITVDIAAGEFISVVGPSGCGKSTLMLMVAGLLQRSHGDIVVGGTTRHQADHRRRHRVPGSPAARISHRIRQRHAAGRHSRLAAEEDRGAREGTVRAAPADARDPQVPAAALGRHAAARVADPHAGARSVGPPDGRAVRRARRADAPAGAHRSGSAVAAPPAYRALHHAQRGGGGRPLRSHPGDEPEPGRGRRGDRGRAAAAASDRARRRAGVRRVRGPDPPALRAHGRAARHRRASQPDTASRA